MKREELSYTFLVALFCVVLVLTNIVGVKLFAIYPEGRPTWMPGSGPLTLTAGIITYPITFLLTDLVSEIWGRKRADHMVWMGFVMSLLMLAILWIAVPLLPSEFWSNATLEMGPADLQQAFEASFYYPGSLLFASMTAYLVAQLFDVRLYHFWWRITRGRHMWIRNNGSTMISQLVDTIIVNAIFLRYAFRMEWGAITEIIAAVYICKVLLAWLDTPLIYLGRGLFRHLLGLEKDAAPGSAPLA